MHSPPVYLYHPWLFIPRAVHPVAVQRQTVANRVQLCVSNQNTVDLILCKWATLLSCLKCLRAWVCSHFPHGCPRLYFLSLCPPTIPGRRRSCLMFLYLFLDCLGLSVTCLFLLIIWCWCEGFFQSFTVCRLFDLWTLDTKVLWVFLFFFFFWYWPNPFLQTNPCYCTVSLNKWCS